ncbi:MAG: sigma-54-dependent Fis family transcriptional regulator [Deltaproteobacteria bacterium]|nr:sigma-54-dependent Fis family transcriptional regulator [Deltaproteobacteria bacterium]
MPKALVIDDELAVCETIRQVLIRQGFEISYATDLNAGVEQACSGKYDVVLLDVRFKEGDGLSVIPRIRSVDEAPEVIIMTAYGDPKGAELAIQSGAFDYLEKPTSTKSLRDTVSRALAYREQKESRRPTIVLKRRAIIGHSKPLQRSLELLSQAASSDIATLITGESGTGKELFAWTIHRNSRRSDKSFVVVDCTALPETLIEGILFGSEKGAYTGADRSREGLIAQADSGTLFLDEVGDIPLSMQKKFLRVLQDKSYRPVGATKERKADFRLIAATNQNLEDMVSKKRFRDDLLYRLQSLRIVLPPLRERTEDIEDLARHHIAEVSERSGIKIKDFSNDFFDVLRSYSWPGNVRELNQAMEKALVAAGQEGTIFPGDLPENVRVQVARDSVIPKAPENTDDQNEIKKDEPMVSLKTYRESVVQNSEKVYLEELMSRVDGDIDSACRISGLSRSRLYSVLKKCGIHPKNSR